MLSFVRTSEARGLLSIFRLGAAGYTSGYTTFGDCDIVLADLPLTSHARLASRTGCSQDLDTMWRKRCVPRHISLMQSMISSLPGSPTCSCCKGAPGSVAAAADELQ